MTDLKDPKWTKALYGMERASLYPYESPKINFLIKKGVLKNLPAGYDFSNRVPVLAIGSNRNPAQIIRKFGNDAWQARVLGKTSRRDDLRVRHKRPRIPSKPMLRLRNGTARRRNT